MLDSPVMRNSVIVDQTKSINPKKLISKNSVIILDNNIGKLPKEMNE